MRYVAMGDSFTEGVGDHNRHLPNGVRGWADRVAEGLAAHQPGWEYANLAIRSKRLRHIIAEQLQPALAMKPDVVTLYAGGNDVMDLGSRVPQMLAELEILVASLRGAGIRVLLFTGFDVEVSALLTPLKRKNHAFNAGVRDLARRYGADLVDYAHFTAYKNPRLWGDDRLHMSKAGHKYLAARVLEILEVPHGIEIKSKPPSPQLLWRQRGMEQVKWWREWVLPMFARKLQGRTLGDDLTPRWPEPVRVPRKKGLKKLL